MPEEVRRTWHCGWLAPEEWAPMQLDAALFDGGFALEDGTPCQVCPGYLALLPQIREAADATWALRKNALPQYYPEPSAVLLEAIRVLDIAYSNWEARRMAEQSAKV